MENPFHDLKQRKVTEKRRLVEEQQQRKERLEQMEALQSKKGFHLSHPIQTMKNKREMRTLHKEIADFEEKKKNKRLVTVLVAMMALCFSVVGIMSAKEHTSRDSSEGQETTEIILQTGPEDSYFDNASTVEENEDTTQQIESPDGIIELSTESADTANCSVDTQKPKEVEGTFPSDETETNIQQEENNIPKLTVSDLTVSTLNDYAHTNTDILYLGNNEGLTITVKASGIGLTEDDILVIYDETALTITSEEPSELGETTYFKYYVTGKQTCKTQIAIVTTYDYVTLGENASGYMLEVKKLDSSDGRIAYVTPTGEKFHFSERCAGENANKTTYRDAVACDYSPCGKCAK